ncbi:MAG TPA: adenosine monophosphate-protein transferase [Desulfurococcales archaeon]|nr:adenosine monophosphate-protein transferase [Desulfurococcales archaeon]
MTTCFTKSYTKLYSSNTRNKCFIKTVEDLYEALITSVPGVKFGIGFCEASGDRLVRHDGNDEELRKLAAESALKIGAGHVFVIYIKGAWPINVLNTLKQVQEVCTIYAATANPVQVIVAETDQGRALVGVVDGYKPVGIEDERKIKERREFLRRIGYKQQP